MPKLIKLEKTSDHVATLIINRPEVRNALSWEAMEQFSQVIETASETADLRALIITGGPQAFCAGGDLYDLHKTNSRQDGVRLSRIMGEALNRLARLPYPTIAAIEGPAMGGGAEIALACDLRIVAESARIGLMHVRLAISTAWGGGPRLVECVGYARALEWQTRGTVLDGRQAYESGLASAIVPDGGALQEAHTIAGEIASNDPATVQGIKQILAATKRSGVAEGARVERQLFPELWAAPAHLAASDRFVNRSKDG